MTRHPTTTAKAERIVIESLPYIREGFGIYDNKGREVGAIVYRKFVRYQPAPETARSWRVLPAEGFGDYWEYTPQATRDGVHYGACQPHISRTTAAQMDEAVQAYLSGARWRAAKKWGAPQ